MEHDGCVRCKYENESADSKYCLGCKQNAIDKYTPMTNFDMCCASIENMAQVIDIAKVGWTKKQIIEWLQSEVKEGE